MTTTAPANTAAFDLLKNQVMANAERTMNGRMTIASVPSPVGSQEPTFVDAYRIVDNEVQPVLSLSGLGGLAVSLMQDLMAATPKDFIVVTTTVKRKPDDRNGHRIVIGMDTDGRPLVGSKGVYKTTSTSKDYETFKFDDNVKAVDFMGLPVELRNWVYTMIRPEQEPSYDRLRFKLLYITHQHIGIFAYGHGPLKSMQPLLVDRGWLGTEAGSSANISSDNDSELVDLMIALLSVLTPDQTYQDIAAKRRKSHHSSK